mgnify:CR=1 FL=1
MRGVEEWVVGEGWKEDETGNMKDKEGWKEVYRQPNEEKTYLVFVPTADAKSPFIGLAFYSFNAGWCGGLPVQFLKAITHWMPLPEWPVDYVADDEGG